MSVEAIKWAFDFDAKNSSEKAILLALANYADGEGRCFPGQESLAKKAACSDRTVRTVLADLEERGVIVREERRRDDGYRTSDNILIVPLSTSPENSSGRKEPHRKISSTSPENSSGPTSFEPPVELPAAAARGKSDLDGLTDKLLEAVGDKIQPHGAIVLAPILGLLDGGCDLETDILPTIRARAAKMTRPAGSWSYFVAAIREAYETRIAAGRGLTKPAPPQAPVELTDEQRRARLGKFLNRARGTGIWLTWINGPPPGRDGCQIPPDMLEPRDLRIDWMEEKAPAA
jgi:hypothetical protein